MTLADKIQQHPLTDDPDALFEFGFWLHGIWREGYAHYNDDSRRLTLQSFGHPEYVAAIAALRHKIFWAECNVAEHQVGAFDFRLPRTDAWLARR